MTANLNEEIDVLIATDCISEGQNLQDCDYLINYDIHWNPVRIIQRFGRIDRIGSQNEKIQLVNFWPDMDLDDYIDLKGRVEARMKMSVLYMVYISQDSEVIINHLDPKGMLDRMSQLCRGKSEPIADLCRKFNAETRDGKRMGTYSRLLGDAISSLVATTETTDLFSFLDGDSGSLFGNEVKGLDDFELICFLIIR